MRVLIVEDEIKIRQGISKLISLHTEHTVVGEAKNGQEGLEMIERFHPELVISDIRMPVMDGLEMLQKTVQRGFRTHFVILSGYSEFEYAQEALRQGVDDYLLKPLAPEDVTALLDKIQKKIDIEDAEHAKTTEGLLRDIILGGQKEMSDDYSLLEKKYTFVRNMPIFMAAGYVGNTSQKYIQALEIQWDRMKEKYPTLHIHYIFLENTQEMFLIMQGDISRDDFEKKLNRRVYQNIVEQDQPVWCLAEFENIENMQETIQKLRSCYLYGLRLGYREIVTLEKIENVPEEEFRYPLQWENRIKTAVCKEKPEFLQKEADEFLKYAAEMKCHPRYIRKTYKKMLAYLESVCHEVNKEAYKRLQNLDSDRAVLTTEGECRGYFQKAITIIQESMDKKEDIGNYAIRRAINYIREHYGENISLDMLAEQLEITPEYLSALFNKEVGINFSTFLKRFRISQAKRLLKGTDKKIYEIAYQVGYNDPKYFNRVFKEEIGVSPGDYRQNN